MRIDLRPTALLFVAAVMGQQASSPYDKWISEDVVYLLQPGEQSIFSSLRTNAERDAFIVAFWDRRDPTPLTAANEKKVEHYRRIAYSNDRFSETSVPGWKSERGRAYITYGPPDEIESHPMEKYEKWLYKSLNGVNARVTFEFGSRPTK